MPKCDRLYGPSLYLQRLLLDRAHKRDFMSVVIEVFAVYRVIRPWGGGGGGGGGGAGGS